MIEIRNVRPKNGEHFSRLLEFCQKVVAICEDLNITPVLSGSLAVFGYTQDSAMSVNDIDLACSESDFPRLCRALDAKGLTYVLKEWHVLQVREDDLKVEFDSMEVWMAGLPDAYDTLMVDRCALQVVSLDSLRELYRRGLETTAGQPDEANRAKHSAIEKKYVALCSASSSSAGRRST
jgi:hypothetical protein